MNIRDSMGDDYKFPLNYKKCASSKQCVAFFFESVGDFYLLIVTFAARCSPSAV